MRFFAAAIVLAVLLGLGAGFYAWRWLHLPLEFPADAADAAPVFELQRGEAFSAFARRLGGAGIVAHPELWTLWARITGKATRVRAGEYRLDAADTPSSLLDRLLAGDVVTYRVQIIEGWTAMQALDAVRQHEALRHEVGAAGVETLLGALGLPAGHAEGLFFPDTYQFVRGDSDADILRRAYQRMQQVLDDLWAGRSEAVPYQTPYEALIVASLIEKETGQEADRAVISQVFANRLELRMRLQTDPAVIYGLGDRFDGDLKRVHLREDTPYNTYVHRGLPPTPIALPGAGSIRAALHPEPGDFLYFVSRGDGSSQFSVSLEEHEQAVRRYQLQ